MVESFKLDGPLPGDGTPPPDEPILRKLPWWREPFPFKTEGRPEIDPAGLEKSNVDGIRATINERYEGQNHPETGVPYIREKVTLPDGTEYEGVFPKFESAADVTLDKNPEGNYEGSREKHEEKANDKLKEAIENNPELQSKFTEEQLEQIRNGETPDGYIWHHHQEPGRMQLVDSEIHSATRHTGGYTLWGNPQGGANHA